MSLDADEIARLLQPYLAEADPSQNANATEAIGTAFQPEIGARDRVFEQLATYLALILKWNARTNLTAIREPAEIVTRHFGESLFLGRHLAAERSLLDLGSGAGFPGIPVQILRPDLQVTLAESQNKKATFLREALRVLELPAEVWGGRAEELGSDYRFDAVTLRAVDKPELAIATAARLAPALYLLTTNDQDDRFISRADHYRIVRRFSVPDGSRRTLLHVSTR